jgi:glucokinase
MKKNCLGIDLGGTLIRGAIIELDKSQDSNDAQKPFNLISDRIPSSGTIEEVLATIISFIKKFNLENVDSIGIGVPGLVDKVEGSVIDVLNIPSWKEVKLASILQDKFQKTVMVENDANCFALGEYFFGEARNCDSLVGVTLGTGMGTGLIINGKIYSGHNGGAGEFGMSEYNGEFLEYFASGQFFKNLYGRDGEEIYKDLIKGNKEAERIFSEFGTHVGNAIKMILYAFDPEVIVLGGSISKTYPYFEKGMNASLETFAYKRSLRRVRISQSRLENAGVLGAAALGFR